MIREWSLSIITKVTTLFNTITICLNSYFNVPDQDYYNNIANFIDYISYLQITSQKYKVVNELGNISNDLRWTNTEFLDYKYNVTSLRRNILTIKQDNSGYTKFNNILKYSLLIVLPFFILHFTFHYWSNKANIKIIKSKLNGILGFPAFELLVLFIILNPIVQSSSILYLNYINTISYNALYASIILLFVIPIPIILLSTYFVTKNIWPWNNIKNKLYYEKNIFPDIKSAIITNSLGKWQPKTFENFCGIFYEHLRGPCQDNKYINFFRIYHVPIKIIKNASIVFVINSYSPGLYGNIKQVSILIFLSAFNVFNMINCRPLNGIRQQICEVLTEITNLSTYVFTIRLINFKNKNNNPHIKNAYLEQNILSSEKAGLGVFILSQIWAGLLSLRLLILFIYHKVHKEKDANHASSNVRTEIAEGNFDEAANTDFNGTDAPSGDGAEFNMES